MNSHVYFSDDVFYQILKILTFISHACLEGMKVLSGWVLQSRKDASRYDIWQRMGVTVVGECPVSVHVDQRTELWAIQGYCALWSYQLSTNQGTLLHISLASLKHTCTHFPLTSMKTVGVPLNQSLVLHNISNLLHKTNATLVLHNCQWAKSNVCIAIGQSGPRKSHMPAAWTWFTNLNLGTS